MVSINYCPPFFCNISEPLTKMGTCNVKIVPEHLTIEVLGSVSQRVPKLGASTPPPPRAPLPNPSPGDVEQVGEQVRAPPASISHYQVAPHTRLTCSENFQEQTRGPSLLGLLGLLGKPQTIRSNVKSSPLPLSAAACEQLTCKPGYHIRSPVFLRTCGQGSIGPNIV